MPRGKDENKRLQVLKDMQVDSAGALNRALHPEADDPPDVNGSWKVLVYMAAYGALRPFAERDLFEMCMVENSPNPKFEVIARVHWVEREEPSEFSIAHGQGNSIRFQPNRRAITATMAQDFDAFLRSHLPGTNRRCLLVLWGHAFDGQFGGFGPNGMSLDEISAALQAARPAGASMVDVLGFDACDMSRIETLQKLSGLAKSLLASQIGVPFSGWPYHSILRKLNASTGMDEKKLSRLIVREYVDSYEPPRVTLTALDGGLQAQYERLGGTITALKHEIDALLNSDVVDLIRDTFNDARLESDDPLLDLREFCIGLRERVQLSQLPALAPPQKEPLLNAIDAVISFHDRLVKQHGRRGPLVSGLNGIGISPYMITQNWNDGDMGIYDRVGWRRPQQSGQSAGTQRAGV